jgi:hypothetical protein
MSNVRLDIRVTATLLISMWSTILVAGARGDTAWKDNGHERFQHVFIIVLENEGFNTTFGPDSKASPSHFRVNTAAVNSPAQILAPFRNQVLLGRLRLLPAITAATVRGPCYSRRSLSPGEFQRHRSTTFRCSRPSRTFLISTAIWATPDSRDCFRFLAAYLRTFTSATQRERTAATIPNQLGDRTEAARALAGVARMSGRGNAAQAIDYIL